MDAAEKIKEKLPRYKKDMENLKAFLEKEKALINKGVDIPITCNNIFLGSVKPQEARNHLYIHWQLLEIQKRIVSIMEIASDNNRSFTDEEIQELTKLQEMELQTVDEFKMEIDKIENEPKELKN